MPAALQFAHVVGPQDSPNTVEGHRSAHIKWQLRVDAIICAPAEIRALLAAAAVPVEGDTWKRYTMLTPGNLASNYTEEAGTEDTGLRVIETTLSQSKDDPQIWDYALQYAGFDDPTYELPEFETQSVEYQEYTNYDVTGRMVENSALDPIAGGMPRDKTQKSYTITRNLTYAQWYVGYGDFWENTVNAKPFVLCRQFDGAGNPILKAPGVVRLKRITEKQMVRVKGKTPATSSYYWRVTAELLIDESTYPNSQAATDGTRVATRHRFVTADRGFNAFDLNTGKKQSILMPDGQKPTEEQFLDGQGRRLVTPTDPPPIAPNLNWFAWAALGKVITRNDYYSVQTGLTLTVAAPGVMDNDEAAAGRAVTLYGATTAHGTLALASNGSFTYTPVAGYTGWDKFTYKMTATGRSQSDATTVTIRVGPQPVFLAFDRYATADWTPIAALLENW